MNFKTTSILFFFYFYGHSDGYSQNKEDVKKVKKILKEAQLVLDQDDYYGALILYKKSLRLDPMNEKAGVDAAICISKLNYPQDSAYFLIDNLSESRLPDANFYLAKIKQQQRLFTEAMLLLHKYNKYGVSKRQHGIEETNHLLYVNHNAQTFIAKPHAAVIKNIGKSVNSQYNDYVPVIIPDESALYFTSKRGTEGQIKNSDNSYFEDVYVSFKENGQWQPAKNIGEPVNSETNDACVAISPDGQRMITYRTSADLVSGDLYITKIGSNNHWEPLQLMPKEINSEYIETSACFSNDTSEIYFSSDRPGGFGGKDLYRLKKLPNQKWARPFNLGENINTKYDEDAPFLHPDGVTLYFSSKGHNTMGDYDIFVSTLNQEKNSLSRAENLGYPINDINNDIFFVLSVDGQRGYYSSVKEENYGGSDIYQIDTRFTEKDLVVKRGKIVLDSLPIRAKITVYEKEGTTLNGTYSSNPANGNFIMVLNPYKSYKALLEAPGCQDQEVQLQAIVASKENEDLLFILKKSYAH